MAESIICNYSTIEFIINYYMYITHRFIMLGQHSLSTVKSVWVVISAKFYRRSDSDFTDSQPKKMRTPCGLKENSILPSSGEYKTVLKY